MSQASFTDDSKTVVEAIRAGVHTEIIEVDGEDFTTRPVYRVPEKPTVKALAISTLDGLIEYLNENVDGQAANHLVVVVNSPNSVSVYKQIDGEKDSRTEWLKATFDVESFPFERHLDHESFMVKAQSLIVDTDERASLLSYIGNLTTALIQTSADDGISQSVTIETGVRKKEVNLPNPIDLAPRRTFAEIEQPKSPFVLRVRQSREGQMPEIALYEADGGLWKIEAINYIKKYIKAKLTLEEGLSIPVIG